MTEKLTVEYEETERGWHVKYVNFNDCHVPFWVLHHSLCDIAGEVDEEYQALERRRLKKRELWGRRN